MPIGEFRRHDGASAIILVAWAVLLSRMTRMGSRATVLAAVLTMALGIGQGVGAQGNDPPDAMLEPMPPRLSLTDGQVSFWRPGAQDWTQAQLNTPLAPGDALATGSPGTLEVQIGARAFVRAWGNTQLSLANQEPDFIQFTLTVGSAVIDLRTLEPGQTVEVDTPNAAVTMAQAGYYRVEVAGERSRVVTRRDGLARVTTGSGQTVTVTPSDEVVIEGTTSPQLAVAAAPPLDEWDRWNDIRTEGFVHAASARYVSPGTYGLSDLDAHGTWRAVPTYGTVWVPTSVPVGWTPYSTGSWILDPVYGWTWVDTAPWGWAPYHHGRWCFVNGYWAWAPGPLIQRPVYAPALVAFLDEPSRGAVSGPGGPAVGWVALGWGEPVVPWWGRWRVAREPSWRGWGGPRVVNNVVIHRKTAVSVHHISVYRNVSAPHAVVAVDRTRFGHGPITRARVLHVDAQRMRPVHGAPQISATPASFAPTAIRGIRPPEESLKRPVVVPRSLPRESQRVLTVPKPYQQELPFRREPVERPIGDQKPSPAAPRPNGITVAPLRPRPVDVPRSTERQSGTLSSDPGLGKGSAALLPLPGATDRRRPTLERGPMPPQAGDGPGGGPRPTGAIGAPRSSHRGQQVETLPPQVRVAPRPGASAGGAAVPGHPGVPPGRAVNRPETSRQPAVSLPGGSANRLAPGRLDKRPASPAGSKS
jgi:hypothetical protein